MTGAEMARNKEAVAAKMREKQAAGTLTATHHKPSPEQTLTIYQLMPSALPTLLLRSKSRAHDTRYCELSTIKRLEEHTTDRTSVSPGNMAQDSELGVAGF